MPTKVVAFVGIKAGQEQAFVFAAGVCAAASRAAPGVLYYDVWQEAGGEQRFVFNELYVDDVAVDGHMASDHFAALGAAIRDIVAGPPVIIRTHAVDVRNLEPLRPVTLLPCYAAARPSLPQKQQLLSRV